MSDRSVLGAGKLDKEVLKDAKSQLVRAARVWANTETVVFQVFSSSPGTQSEHERRSIIEEMAVVSCSWPKRKVGF
jgi:hypothetical protein